MDGETAQFDSIHKVPSPEGAIDLTARNGLHDIMMSSFYANGAEDSRDLFSNPCDLGPETDVDLLDDDVGGRAEQLQKDEAWCGGEKVVCSEETGGIRKEEDLEVVGGGVEEEEDDSEDEDAEWKYVSVKSPGSGVVPVSHEPSLEDNPFDRRAPSGHDIDPLDFLEQSVEAGQQVVPKDSGFLELFTSKESAEKQELDENKICPELASEVVQKVELEENPNLIEDLSIEELQKQVSGGNIFSVGSLQEEFIGESKESTEEAAMESRLNPDAAEFVPISPTRNTVSETLNGVGNEFDLFKKEAEALSSVGNEFDMFRKEAEACPGEVCDEMSTIPTEIVGRPIVNEDLSKNPFDRSDLADSDVVLSSSFNYEQRNLEVMDYLGSAEESAVQGSYNFAEEDEDKENIPVCDDKENMRLSPNAEVVSAEDVALITQERELERLEETIFENVSGTSDTPGLQTADSSSLDVLKERVEFDQRFPDSEQQSESAESPNLMVCDHGQRMQSPEIPQAVEQTYVLESKIPQEEEVLVQLDDKVRSLEPVEASLEPVTETKSSVEEPVVVLQSLGNLDFTEIEQDLLGVNENYETFGKQGMKQDLIESELVPVNVGMQIIEEGLVPANENQEENVAHTHDDFEIIQSPEKVEEKSIENVSQEIENDPKDFHQTYEKLSHELKEEIGKSYETAEFHDSTQKASEDSYSQEEIASAVQNVSSNKEQMILDEHIIAFEVQNVSSNKEQMILDEHIMDSCKEMIKLENEIEFETEIKKDIEVADHELLAEIDQQMSDLSVNDEQHVTERYQEDVELSHTEKVEICSPAHEESEQRPTFQMEDNYDDMLQTHLKDEKTHIEGEQYQIEIEQEFQVKSSEDINSESLIDTSAKNIAAEVEIIPSPVLLTDLEKVSSSEQLLSPSPVPETIPVLETCPEILVTKSPTPGAELSSEIKIPSPVVEHVTQSVQEDIPKLDLSASLGHEAVTPNSEIISSVNASATEPEFEAKEVTEVKDEQVTAEVSPVVQSPSEAVSQTAVLEQAIAEKVEKESTETPKIAEVIPSLPLDAKSPAKKTPSADKKKTPEKSKAPAAAPSKGKVAARSSVPPSRTNLTAAKTSATSPTKPSGTKPTPTERKTAPPAAGKPAAPSKSTTAPMSSKPRTSMTKPSPVPTTKSAPVKSSTTASRPGTASSKPASVTALSKPASSSGTTKPASASRPSSASTTLKSSSAISKPASATAKSTVTQSKVTEVKRAVNGDTSKSLPQNTSAAPKPAPRKVPLSSTTAASKPSPSLTRTSAKPLSTAVKAASESTKPKLQNVVNGTASKSSRPVNSTAPKPPTSLSAQARKPLPKTSTSTVSDPKKAKESANKHISATRTSVGSPATRRSTDLKGSLASKAAAAKGRPSEPKAPLSNGTVSEKTSETVKEVEGKIDLMIKENGVDVEIDVRKEEEIAVQELCTVKEQVMLIVEEGVREAM